MVTPTAAYKGALYIGSNEIKGVTNVKLTDKDNTVDITALDDASRVKFPTIQDWSLSFDLVAVDRTDTGQSALFAAKSGQTKSLFKLTLDASGTHYYSGYGYVESIDISASADDVIKASVSIVPAGELTYT